MKLQQVQAESRLTKVRFILGRDWLTYPPAIFTCGVCQQEVHFTLKDFIRHESLDYTNLSEADDKAMRALQQASHESTWNAFLDFYCPQCRSPVRIYYEIGELVGSRSRAYGAHVAFIIEKAQTT